MTPERFEELVKLGAKAVLGPNFSSENLPYLQSIAEKNTRVTLTAVLSLYRNEVIEECAAKVRAADLQGGWTWPPKIFFEDIVNQLVARIRALKTKEPT